MSPSRQSTAYLLGIFLSSLGSLTYISGLVTFLPAFQVATVYIGVLFAAIRLTSFLVNITLGHIGDEIDPRKVVIFCEFASLIGSLIIFISWPLSSTLMQATFLIGNVIRVGFVSVQAASIQKYAQTLDRALSGQGTMAVLLTRAMQGSLLFGGLLSFVFLKYLSLHWLIIFDAVTFLMNGFMVFAFQSGELTPASSTRTLRKLNFRINFLTYFQRHRSLAIEEALVTLTQMGSNTLIVMLFVNSPNFIPFAVAGFGAAVWISSWIVNNMNERYWKSQSVWLVYAVAIFAQGLFSQSPIATLAFCFVGYICFWLIINRIVKKLMVDCPPEIYSEVSSSRGSVNLAIFSIGEIWVGLKVFPMFFEMLWRATLAILASTRRR